MTEAEMAEINGRHARAMRYLVIVMAVLVVGGIAIDVVHGAEDFVCHGRRVGPVQEVVVRVVSWRTR